MQLKLMQGDCLALMKNMPDRLVDLTITSPPYDNLRTYNGAIDHWDFEKFKAVAKELYRVTADGGVVVWVAGDATIKGSETGTSFRQVLWFKECGFNLHDTMIYRKMNPTPQKSNRYQPCFEYMFVLSKGKPKTFNPILVEKRYLENRKGKQYNKRQDGTQIVREYTATSTMKVKDNIWEYSVGLYNSTSDKEAFKHPAVFPEQLAADHIKSWSNPGDVVFDPFMGSGTTGKMALLNHRRFIGIELDLGYFEIAKARIAEYQNPGMRGV